MPTADPFTWCSKLPVVATCGFRFWDSVTNLQVTDELEVDAIVAGYYNRVVRAFQSNSRVFGGQALHLLIS